MSILVSDPFGAALDAQMPTLASALNPLEAKKELKRRLPRLSGQGKLRLREIRVTRYKPGRRCVVEYDVSLEGPDIPPQALTLIGKIRARRFGNESYRLLDDFWNAGFSGKSPDGISVPEPIGVLSRFQMWFQRKLPGETATRLLAGPGGAQLASRIADAIHKMHCAGVHTDRQHGITEELRILHECLAKVRQARPDLSARLERLARACDGLAGSLPAPQLCGIHRDFYPAQVIVHDNKLCLIDFDLYCLGDPALDIGNFIGHMTEQALREMDNPAALALQEQKLEVRFIELAGEKCRPAINAYTTLTLARHVYLSTVFPERHHCTEALLGICEQRLRLR